MSDRPPAPTPCPSCPWRREADPTGDDIPGFDLPRARRLVSTVGDDDWFRPIMACHGSTEGKDTPCVGYLYVEGYRNLAVRMQAIDGCEVSRGALANEPPEGLYESFGEMLEAMEAAADED